MWLLPTLALELDELHDFVETVIAEEDIKNPDTSFFTEDPRQDTDDDLGEQDLETFSDFNDVNSEVSDSESVNDNKDDGTLGYLQMDPEVISTLIAGVKRAHNLEVEEHDCRFIYVNFLLIVDQRLSSINTWLTLQCLTTCLRLWQKISDDMTPST